MPWCNSRSPCRIGGQLRCWRGVCEGIRAIRGKHPLLPLPREMKNEAREATPKTYPGEKMNNIIILYHASDRIDVDFSFYWFQFQSFSTNIPNTIPIRIRWQNLHQHFTTWHHILKFSGKIRKKQHKGPTSFWGPGSLYSSWARVIHMTQDSYDQKILGKQNCHPSGPLTSNALQIWEDTSHSSISKDFDTPHLWSYNQAQAIPVAHPVLRTLLLPFYPWQTSTFPWHDTNS